MPSNLFCKELRHYTESYFVIAVEGKGDLALMFGLILEIKLI